MVTSFVSAATNTDQTAIGVLAPARRDPFRHDGAARILAEMNHFCAGIRLLAQVGERDRVELANGVIAFEDATRIFPGDSRARFYLGPGDFRVVASAFPALGDEVEDAAFAVLITRIPILHRRIFNHCTFFGDELHDRGMQLIFIAHRCGATLKIADVGAFIRNDQGTFKLPGVQCVNAKVG